MRTCVLAWRSVCIDTAKRCDPVGGVFPEKATILRAHGGIGGRIAARA